MIHYDEDYFERGLELGISCYTNYRWIPELTIPLCDSIAHWAGITKNDKILDYGCAKGYLVKGFRLLHYDCYGVDISEYAISSAPNEIKKYVKLIDEESIKSYNEKYDWIICKDVLEHIHESNLDDVLSFISRNCKSSFVVLPLGDGEKYNIQCYENDATHLIKQPIEWWCDKFAKNYLNVRIASYSAPYIKQNYSNYKNGNGFFILDSRY